MAMGQRGREQQGPLWIPADQVAKGPGRPFYRKLNEVFAQRGFDRFTGRCTRVLPRPHRALMPRAFPCEHSLRRARFW